MLGARVSEGGRRQLGKVGDGGNGGGREGGRRRWRRRRTAAREEKGKFKMRGFLQSDVGAEGETTKGRRGVSPRKNSVAGYYSQIMVPPI